MRVSIEEMLVAIERIKAHALQSKYAEDEFTWCPICDDIGLDEGWCVCQY